jgi:hypothetical protein
MSLTPEQQAHVMRWFQAKMGKRKCPVCRKSSWKVETDAALQRVEGGAVDETRSMSVVVVGCLHCAHFLLFSSSILYQDIPEDHNEGEEG